MTNGQKITSRFGMVLVFGPKARDPTAQSEGPRCISHLLGNLLGLKYNSLIIKALSTNGAVHTSLGQRPRTCGRTKKNPSCLRSRTKGPRAETGGMVKLYSVLAYAVLGRCPRLVWDGPSALKPNPLIYRCIRVL